MKVETRTDSHGCIPIHLWKDSPVRLQTLLHTSEKSSGGSRSPGPLQKSQHLILWRKSKNTKSFQLEGISEHLCPASRSKQLQHWIQSRFLRAFPVPENLHDWSHLFHCFIMLIVTSFSPHQTFRFSLWPFLAMCFSENLDSPSAVGFLPASILPSLSRLSKSWMFSLSSQGHCSCPQGAWSPPLNTPQFNPFFPVLGRTQNKMK